MKAFSSLVALFWVDLFAPSARVCNFTRADMNALEAAIAMYRMNTGTLPSPEDGLDALMERPKSLPAKVPWMRAISKLPTDPWDRPFHYVRSLDLPDGFGIFSTGEDGVSKTLGNDPDDVNSWSGPDQSKEPLSFAVVFFWPAVISAGLAGFLLGKRRQTLGET